MRIILPFSYLEKALNLTLATWETETTESTLNKDACLMNTSLGRYVRCCIMDAMSDYRLSTLYDPQTLSSACLWYVLRDFKIFPEEKFIPWVISVTGNTQIREDIQDAVDDLIQLNLKRRVGRESSDSQMNISKKQCYNIQD